jgi:transcription-repair coupling factor (superfamily II helicase)
MSLAGVRDMSTIETPPEERLPIKTYVSEESDDLIREAILRELDRGGQVFYLHNRVKDIELVGNRIQRLVPEADIQVGHGQMPEDELEKVMAAFDRGEFDVLLCTTIIESGIDLPNVNTLIVDRADMFGLSQLYQLRGRIGRGANRAYAYLMVPRAKQITEQAEQRLNTILAATELGAGFQIALRDLEIRGIGNLLGVEQSGHISAIGFDLYTKLLAEAVRELKTSAVNDGSLDLSALEFSAVRVDIGVDARIPDSYIEDLAQRLLIYQRLARMHTGAEINELDEEIRDRFGPPPPHLKLLMQTAHIRILAEQAWIESVAGKENRIVIKLKEPTGGARAALQRQLGSGVDVGHMQIRVDIDRDSSDWIDELLAVIEEVKIFQERLIQIMELATSGDSEPNVSSISAG